MRRLRFYGLLPTLAFWLLFACVPKDQVDKDDQDNQTFTQYTVYGVYGKTDTLFCYKQYDDEWSILSYDVHYHFRIQNYRNKTVVTFSNIPNEAAVGDRFAIGISALGVEGISEGTKEVQVVFKENHTLQLYDEASKIHYVVYQRKS
ncbi:MAG: hypothetical protein WBK97_01170 [Bacteroidales bacterium]|jgi:hypothetical protein